MKKPKNKTPMIAHENSEPDPALLTATTEAAPTKTTGPSDADKLRDLVVAISEIDVPNVGSLSLTIVGLLDKAVSLCTNKITKLEADK